MKRQHTELLDFVINPTFLERMQQPVSSFEIRSWFNFTMKRKGRLLHFTMYTGDSGQVNVSDSDQHGCVVNTILRDFCQTPEDFYKMLDKLDDLLTRIPKR
jgi:hypothetical protein